MERSRGLSECNERYPRISGTMSHTPAGVVERWRLRTDVRPLHHPIRGASHLRTIRGYRSFPRKMGLIAHHAACGLAQPPATLHQPSGLGARNLCPIENIADYKTPRTDHLHSRIFSLQKRVHRLQSRVHRLQSRVHRLQSRILRLQSRILRLQSRVHRLQSRILRLHSRIYRLQSRILPTFTPLDTVFGQLEPVYSKLEKAADRVAHADS